MDEFATYHFANYKIKRSESSTDFKMFNCSDDEEHHRYAVENSTVGDELRTKSDRETNEEDNRCERIDHIPGVTEECVTLLT